MDSLFEPTSFSIDGRRYGGMGLGGLASEFESCSSFLSFSSFATLDKDTLTATSTLGGIGANDAYNTSPTSQSTSSFTDATYADDPFIAQTDPFEIVNSAFGGEADLDFGIDINFGLGGTSGLGIGEDDFDFGGDFLSTPSSAQAGPSKPCSNNRIYDLGTGTFTYTTFGAAGSSSSAETSNSPPRPTTSVSEYDGSPLVTPSSRDRHTFSSTSPDCQRAGFAWDDAHYSLGSSSSLRRPQVDPATSIAPTYAATPTPLRVVSNPTLGASAAAQRPLKAVMSMPALKEEDVCSDWLNIPDGPDQVQHPAQAQNYDWVFGDLGMDQASLDGTIFAAFKEGESGSDSWSDLANMAALPVQTPKMMPAPTPLPPSAGSSINKPVPIQSAQVESTFEESQVFMPESASAPSSMTTMAETPAAAQMFDMDPFAFTSSNADIRPATAPEVEGVENFGILSAPGVMTRSYTAPGIPHRAAPSDIFYQPLPVAPAPASVSTEFTGSDAFATGPTHPAASSSSTPNISHTQPNYLPQTARSFSGRRSANPQLSVNVDSPSFSAASSSTSAFAPTYPLTPQSAVFPSHSTSFSSLQAPVPMQRAGSQPLPTRRASSANIRTTNAPGEGSYASANPTPGGPPLPAHMLRAQAMVQMHEAKEEAQRQELRRQAAARRIPMAEASVMQPLLPPTPTRPAVVGWEGPQQQQQHTQYVQAIPVSHFHHQPPVQQQQQMVYQPMQPLQQQQQHYHSQVMMSHPPAPVQQQQPSHYQPQQQMYAPAQQAHAMPPQHVQHPPQPQQHSQPTSLHQPQPTQAQAYAFQSQPPKSLAPPEYDAHSRARSNPLPVSHPPPPGGHPVAQPIMTTQPLLVHPPTSAGFTYTAPPPHRIHPPPPSAGLPMTATASGTSLSGYNTGVSINNRPMARLPSPKSRKVSSPSKQRSPSGKRRTQTAPGSFSWGEATFINFTSNDAEKLLSGVAPSGSQNKRKREEEQARMMMQQAQAQAQGQVQAEGQLMMSEDPAGKRTRVE